MAQPPFKIFLVPTWLRVLTWCGTLILLSCDKFRLWGLAESLVNRGMDLILKFLERAEDYILENVYFCPLSDLKFWRDGYLFWMVSYYILENVYFCPLSDLKFLGDGYLFWMVS